MARPNKYPEFPGVSEQTDRKGNVYFRVRRSGLPEKRLPGEFGSREFVAAYRDYMKGVAPVADVVSIAKPRTLRDAYDLFRETTDYTGAAPLTQDNFVRRMEEQILQACIHPSSRMTWAEARVTEIEPKHIRAFIARIEAKHKTVGRPLLTCFRYLMACAVNEGWMTAEANPTLSLQASKAVKSIKNRPWEMSERRKFEETFPIGHPARTAYTLALWLGARRNDLQTLTFAHIMSDEIELENGDIIDRDVIKYRQSKNANKHGGKLMQQIIPRKVAEVLQVVGHGVTDLDRPILIGERTKKPYTSGLSCQMIKWVRRAKLPKGLTLHGLRHTFAVELAEAGIPAQQLMDAMGHSSLTVTETYLRGMSTKRNQNAAMLALDGIADRQDARNKRRVGEGLKLVSSK